MGAFSSQEKKAKEQPISKNNSRKSLNDKYSTKTFQPRNALVASSNEVSEPKSKPVTHHRINKVQSANSKVEDARNLGAKKASYKSEFVQLVNNHYEMHETGQIEGKHGLSSTISHHISASAFSPTTIRDREDQTKFDLINEHSRAVKQL